MKKPLLAMILTAVTVVSGCTQAAPALQAGTEEVSSSTVENYGKSDPKMAMTAIYENIDIKGVNEASVQTLEEKFLLDLNLLTTYDVRYASGRYGIADVFILKPKAGEMAKVREQLEQIKLMRMKEAEHYDVYRALETAQNAMVFEQGEYAVLLMVPDLEAAKKVIDYYIMKN